MPQWMAGGFGWGTYVAESRHDWAGRATAVDLGNTYGAVVSYRYDPVTAQLTGLALDREQIDGSDLAVTYKYDDGGNLERAWDRPTNTALGATRQDNQCFDYDGLRRLTRAWTATTDAADCPTESVTSSLVGGASKYWTSWEYDDLGNRVKQIDHTTSTTTEYGHGPQPEGGYAGPHAMTSTTVKVGSATPETKTYTHDKAGRQTLRGSAGQTQVWDAESELSSVKTATSTTASFVYDANGDRLTRSDSTGTTVYLPGGQEILVTSTGVKSATRYYTFDGQTVAVRTKNGLRGVTSLVNDPHGTTLAAVPNTTWTKTSVIKRYTTPFGALRGSSDTVPGDRQFLNKPKDATGLTMIGARYYDDAHGRFLSVDPVMDLTDPQQWNGYAYANNNPTTWSDPTGLIINMPRPDTDVYNGQGHSDRNSGTNDGGATTTPWFSGPMTSRSPSPARAAAEMSYELMVEWIQSTDGRKLFMLGPGRANRINAMLDAIIDANNGGGFGAWLRTVANVPVTLEDWEAVGVVELVRKNFPDRGRWDAKVPLGAAFANSMDDEGFLDAGNGTVVNYDVFGNVIYGYMLARTGVSEENAINAANFGAEWTGVDDPRDDTSITLGYELAARDPMALTAGSFSYFILGESLGRLMEVGAAHAQ